jgi:hypothetical protein
MLASMSGAIHKVGWRPKHDRRRAGASFMVSSLA